MRRPFFLALALGLIALVGLNFVPPAGLLALFLLGPALTAWLATRPGADRNRYSGAGVQAAIALGLAGVFWVGIHPEGMNVFGVIVSLFATFMVVSIMSSLVVVLASNLFPRPAGGTGPEGTGEPNG
ncbi:MAG: hypothetical protein HYX53_00625 [Chloroflexi bacterium]|nr:hypothetical protein [Chloroflexota bacterium]